MRRGEVKCVLQEREEDRERMNVKVSREGDA